MTQDHTFALGTALPADAAPIAEVHVRAWQVAYAHLLTKEYLRGLSVAARASAWSTLLGAAGSTTLVARAGTQVIGFATFGAARDADAALTTGELWALYVLPQHWGGGVGAGLLRAALDGLVNSGCTAASLWVLEGNARAIAFYERMGFGMEADAVQEIERGGRRLNEVRMRRAIGRTT